jgi:hypothetical protein
MMMVVGVGILVLWEFVGHVSLFFQHNTGANWTFSMTLSREGELGGENEIMKVNHSSSPETITGLAS